MGPPQPGCQFAADQFPDQDRIFRGCVFELIRVILIMVKHRILGLTGHSADHKTEIQVRLTCLPNFLSEQGLIVYSFLLQDADQTVSLLLEKCVLKCFFPSQALVETSDRRGVVHKKPGITVAAVVLASGVGIDTVVKDLGFVENAFGFDFTDNH